MSCLKIPVGICKEIESMGPKFWWGENDESSRRLHCKSWTKMATSKDIEGLGFRDIQCFNLALLAKQPWCLITQPNLMMSRVLKAKYFSHGGLLNAWRVLMRHGSGRAGYQPRRCSNMDCVIRLVMVNPSGFWRLLGCSLPIISDLQL